MVISVLFYDDRVRSRMDFQYESYIAGEADCVRPTAIACQRVEVQSPVSPNGLNILGGDEETNATDVLTCHRPTPATFCRAT